MKKNNHDKADNEPIIESIEPDEKTAKGHKTQLEVIGQILLPTRERASKFKLRFSPYAWAKLRWIRDYKNSEIAGFGISSVEDPFYMEDFQTIKQTASAAHFQFNDEALNTFMADQFEAGKQPGECMRLWVHTHPTHDFAAPSATDEATFKDAFGAADWAMMIIVDEGDNVYARLRVKSGVTRLQMVVPSTIDCQPPFASVTEESAVAWKQEADDNIILEPARFTVVSTAKGVQTLPARDSEWARAYHDQFRRYQQRRQEHRHRSTYQDPMVHGFDPLAGGGYPLSHEPDPIDDMWDSINMLILLCEKVVRITEDKKTGGTMILMHNVWAIYAPGVEIACVEDSDIISAKDIANVPPMRCGEVLWTINTTGDYEEPTFTSEVLDGFVSYFEDQESADNHTAVQTSIEADIAADNAEEAARLSTLDDVVVEHVEKGVPSGPSGP